MALSGLLFFPGLRDYQSFSVNLAHGITPSTFTIVCPPGYLTPEQGRTLSLAWDATRIDFKQCKLDRMELITGSDGKQYESWTVLDRRWKWREAPGQISGVYNVPTDDGSGKFLPGTEKTPQELAILCLRAMGETRFNVGKLPNGDRPTVEWEYAEPAQELARLCENYGCRVVLKLDDSVAIEVVGKGAQLPAGPMLYESNDGIDPPERPDEIRLVLGRTEHQLDLELEAVAEDVDGMFKPFANLSYAKGLPNLFVTIDVPYFSQIADKKVRELAAKSVFKCYRIKTPFTVPRIEPNGPPIVVNDLKQILPLLGYQVELKKAAAGTPQNQIKEEQLPPWVYGIWCNKESGWQNVTNTLDPSVQKTDKSKGFYADSFTIDQERGLVWFSDHVFRTIPPQRPGDPAITVTAGGRSELSYMPAVLRLRIAINLRDNNRAFFHWEKPRRMRGPKFDTEPLFVQNYQQALKWVTSYNANGSIKGTTSNQAECERMAKIFLDAKQAEYQVLAPQSRTYVGFQKIDLDGAIQQITFSRGEDGFSWTKVTRDTEEIVTQPSYKEKRKVEREAYELKPGTPPPARVQSAEFSLGKVKA